LQRAIGCPILPATFTAASIVIELGTAGSLKTEQESRRGRRYSDSYRPRAANHGHLAVRLRNPVFIRGGGCSLERRWSSHRFSYSYLVTTSPQLPITL